MKTLKMLALVVVFAFSGVLAASTEPVKKTGDEPTTVTSAVSELLKNPQLELNYDEKATVMLTINEDNEIVVLSVDSENVDVKSFIKSRLNYKKLDVNFSSKLKAFNVPVKILAN